jgi:hypothetical protein
LSQKSLNLKRLFGHSIILIIRCNRAAWLETGEDRAGSKFSEFLSSKSTSANAPPILIRGGYLYCCFRYKSAYVSTTFRARVNSQRV